MPMGLSLLLLLCLKGRQSEKEQQNRLKDEERCVKLMHIKDVGGGPFGRGLRSMKMTSKPTCGIVANKKNKCVSGQTFTSDNSCFKKAKVCLQMFDEPLLRRFAEEHACSFLPFCLPVVY